jgi:hypothetical protein
MPIKDQRWKMRCFLVHCGFYDTDVCEGLYESHANFFVAAEDFDEAKQKAKQIPEFKSKRMHVDGLQEISAVSGYRISLTEDSSLSGDSLILNYKHRELSKGTTI